MIWATVLGLGMQAQAVDAVYIGHSLISDIPDMVAAISPDRFRFKEQFIPGAPLRWQWEEPTRKGDHEPQFRGVYDRLISSSTDVLVLIDSVPRGEPASIDESIDYSTRFVRFAREKNKKVAVFYYEPWHHITSGTPQRSEYDKASPSRELKFRPRLKEDRAKWERVVRDVNLNAPGDVPVKMIPVGSGLGLLSDEIDAGRVPGLKSMRDLFDDDIHLNPLGKYYVAMIHHRFILGSLPGQLPTQVKGRWGGEYFGKADWQGKSWEAPSAATVEALRKVSLRVE